MRERTWLRVFWIEADCHSLLGYATIDFEFVGSCACTLRIMAEQNAEHAEQSAFKIERLDLLSLVVGALCRFHKCVIKL